MRPPSLRSVVRLLALGTLAGAGVGLVAFGIGSRLAMRAVFLAAGPETAGLLTENGNPAGLVTLDGTVSLLAIGAVFGLPGGLAYLALEEWVPSKGWRKGALFGIAILGVIGTALIDASNEDFERFAPGAVGIVAMAALYLAAGLLVVPVVAFLDRKLPREPRGWALAGLGIVAAVGALLATVMTLLLVFDQGRPELGLAVVAALAYGALARATRSTPHVWWRRPAVAYGVLTVPCALGTFYLLRNAATILGL